jgi:hypothetical protein
MTCSCILDEYPLACRDNTGGVARVWIGCYDSSVKFSMTASYVITGATGPTINYYLFEQETEVASFVQNGQFSIENGTTFFEQTLEITLHKMDAANRNRVQTLSYGSWRVIILDQRGNYWLMGYQNPVRVSSAAPQLGKAYGDLNGAIITFTGKEPQNAYLLDPTFALTLI